MELLKALELIREDVSVRDAKLCFSLSRMAVIDGRTAKGKLKETNLPFEGFMEALCRLSVVKALPTDEELARLQCPDAGVFMQRLLSSDFDDQTMDEFDPNVFFAERGADWGETPRQPMHRCLSHTIACIIRAVEAESRGEDDLQITRKEAQLWAKDHLKPR